MAMPLKNPTSIKIRLPDEVTAANAELSIKWPTMSASTALYSCWKILPSRMGKANISSFFQMTPSVNVPSPDCTDVPPSYLFRNRCNRNSCRHTITHSGKNSKKNVRGLLQNANPIGPGDIYDADFNAWQTPLPMAVPNNVHKMASTNPCRPTKLATKARIFALPRISKI